MEIQQKFPGYLIEDGFTKEDELWSHDVAETPHDIEARASAVLDMIFRNDKELQCEYDSIFTSWGSGKVLKTTTVIAITTHWGFINNFLRATGHHVLIGRSPLEV